MNLFNEAITTSRVVRSRRNSMIRLVERTLTMLIIGLAVIMVIQHVYITGGAKYHSADAAHAGAASQNPAYKFVRGTYRVDRVSPDRDG